MRREHRIVTANNLCLAFFCILSQNVASGSNGIMSREFTGTKKIEKYSFFIVVALLLKLRHLNVNIFSLFGKGDIW